jgi:transposase
LGGRGILCADSQPMAAPKHFEIKESMAQLRRLHGQSRPMMAARLRALIVFKAHERTGISKKAVALETGSDPNSVQAWRTAYIEGGLEKMLSHDMGGNRPSVISADQEAVLREKIHDPRNGVPGFMELMHWFEERFGEPINYKTLNGYVKRKYEAKVKTARKSHITKDPMAAEAFKKTSRSAVPS